MKISELPAATALAGTETLPVVQGGATKGATVAQVLAGATVDLSAYALTSALTAGLATKAPTSHAHPTSDVTGFNAAASAAAPVQSVAGRTGAVVLSAADIASGQLAMARLASGTPDGTKFVRDDGTLATPAGGFANPMTTAADIIVGGTAGAPARLAKGAALQVLRVNAGATALEYATASGGVPEARVLAINTTKVDVTSGTSTTDYLAYTVDRAPSEWIAPGIMYRAVLTGRCSNTSGATRTLDLALSFGGTLVITIRLAIAVTVSPTFIPWTFESLVSYVGEDLIWVNATAYLGAGFNGSTGLVDTAGTVYAGSKQASAVSTLGVTSMALSLTYKRDSTVSTYTVTLANSFIQQIKV